jgi:hypothetical protein
VLSAVRPCAAGVAAGRPPRRLVVTPESLPPRCHDRHAARLADGFGRRPLGGTPRLGARRRHAGHGGGRTPRIGPALTVAVLLPVTFASSRRARSSCSAGSTTARCTAARPPASC